jgi:drug/metabolite transporter (DMT)-like permease
VCAGIATALRSAARVRSAPIAVSARALGLTWSDGAALLAVLLWSFSFPITKDVMTMAAPLVVSFARGAITSLMLFILLGLSGQWHPPERKDLARMLAVGFIGMTLNSAVYAYGLHLTSVTHAGLIFTLTPLLVFALSHLLGHLRLRGRDLVGLLVGLCGAAVIVGAPLLSAGGSASGASLLGDVLIGLAAATWGLWTLLATPLLRRYGTLRATAWLTLTGTVGLLPLAVPDLLTTNWVNLPWQAYGGFAYSGGLAGVGGALLWYGSVRRIGAARTMIYANMESFFVVLIAALLLGERAEWTALAGGVAVIAGVLLTRRAEGG